MIYTKLENKLITVLDEHVEALALAKETIKKQAEMLEVMKIRVDEFINNQQAIIDDNKTLDKE